jgi:hypothetical protein
LARLMRAAIGWLLFLLLALGASFYARDYVREHPQDFPWTELSLDQPIGRFTGQKLVSLSGDGARCRNLLHAVGSQADPVPARREGDHCGYDDGMRLGERDLAFAPRAPVTSCPVAAALFMFDGQVLQPAAQRHFGQPVVRIQHAGSYSCRRLYGRTEGAYSEHATANALDITGFQLEDGRTISVLRDWESGGPDAAFLKDVRDGACALFGTVLSPTTTRHMRTICIWTRREGEMAAGACAASEADSRLSRTRPQRKRDPRRRGSPS